MNLAMAVLSNGDLLVGQYEATGELHTQTVIELKEPVLIKHVSNIVPRQTKIVGQHEPLGLVIKVSLALGVSSTFVAPSQAVALGIVTPDDLMYQSYVQAITPKEQPVVNA